MTLFAFDALNMVITGALRGAGKQVIVTKLSIIQSYVVAIPVAIGLGFYTDLGLFGIWSGLGCGVVVASMGGAFMLFRRLDWKAASKLARERSKAEGAGADGNS